MPNATGRRIFLRRSAGLLGLTGLSLVACSSVSRGDSIITPTKGSQKRAVRNMKLESTAFAADGLIPSKYTCDGADISPPLRWDAPPTETQSLALIVDDPDAPGGTYTHWVLYDLPAAARGLPEGVSTQQKLLQPRELEGAVQGTNDFGKFGYGGPCPPSGTHRYFFKLYALERKLSLEPGATKEQLVAAMERHILAATELIGRYSRR